MPRPPAAHGTITSYRKGCRCEPCRDAKRAEKAKYSTGAPPKRRTPREPKHGTLWEYQRGCRCAECKQTNADRSRAVRRSLYPTNTEKVFGPKYMPPEKHGKENGYVNWGCRCEPCKEAARAKRQEKYLKGRDKALAEAPVAAHELPLPATHEALFAEARQAFLIDPEYAVLIMRGYWESRKQAANS